MPRHMLNLTLFVLFLLEGTVVQQWLTFGGANDQLFPRLTLVAICLISFFLGRREGWAYGLVFGLLHDVIYNQIIGVYTLAFMIAGYFSGLVTLLFHRSIVLVLVTTSLVLFGHEWLLYSLFRLFSTGITDVQWMLTQQILPSVAFNAGLTMLFYLPLLKLCNAVDAAKGMKLD